MSNFARYATFTACRRASAGASSEEMLAFACSDVEAAVNGTAFSPMSDSLRKNACCSAGGARRKLSNSDSCRAVTVAKGRLGEGFLRRRRHKLDHVTER